MKLLHLRARWVRVGPGEYEMRFWFASRRRGPWIALLVRANDNGEAFAGPYVAK